MQFSMYYMIRSLDSETSSDMISESAVGFDVRKFARDNKKKSALQKHISYFSKRHPQARNCDIEDAVMSGLSEISKKKPSDESSATRMIRRHVKDYISDMSKKSKDARKKLSCLKSIKSLSEKGIDLKEMIGKAKGVLTVKETKVLEMCSRGKSVRQMAAEMKTSFPTAWRILNKALDKVRMSNGMKGRYMDRR